MSAPPAVVDLIFLWHHHQPDYRSPRERRSVLPWVRLHATKDYLDMALRLARFPRVRATFNFVPSLLDQLDDVALGRGDELFELLARPIASLDAAERAAIARRCALVPPWAREKWNDLGALIARASRRGAASAAADRDLLALEIAFLIAWIDPVFHGDPAVAGALGRRGAPSESDRDALLALHRRLTAEVVPAYRALAERGQIELAASAYFHPILPLLIDPRSLMRARPDLHVPAAANPAPEDAARQVERALERHAQAFGERPGGMWPPEGSVSPETAECLSRAGVTWIASDEGVLWHSLAAIDRRRELLYRPWRVPTPAGEIAMLFRDHELSDRIGFVYHHWRPETAADDFLARVRRIAREHGQERRLAITVILDGENCWEHYPEDGGPFLDALYERLQAADDIHTTTPGELLARAAPRDEIARLHSGSWIDADFHIWMGHAEKNRAWDYLGRTRLALVEAGATPASHPEAWNHLDAAAGSDWFWWFGDDHFTPDKAVFDRLFREHLQGAWSAIGREAPLWLESAVARALDDREHARRPIGILRPVLDGERTNFYEWHAAGRLRTGAGGSMHRQAGAVSDLFYGFDLDTLYLRLDFAKDRRPGPAAGLVVELAAPRICAAIVRSLARGRPAVEVEGAAGAAGGGEGAAAGASCAIGSVLELGLPFAALGLAAGDEVELRVRLVEAGATIETVPDGDMIRFTVPDESYEFSMWSA